MLLYHITFLSFQFYHLSFFFFSVHVRPGFCAVNQSLVAMSTAAGANGEPGPSARFLVEEESSSGDDSAIIRLLRAEDEAAQETVSSRKTATHTPAQVQPTNKTDVSPPVKHK